MRTDSIPSRLFSGNRGKFMEKMERGSVAVICANDAVPRNGDQFYPFRQDSDFFYLTGIDQAGSVLIAVCGVKGIEWQEILYLEKPDPNMVVWTGPGLTKEAGAAVSGIADVRWMARLENDLDSLMNGVKKIYENGISRRSGRSNIHTACPGLHDTIREKYPGKEFSSASELTVPLRMVKEEEEITGIRQAAEITRSSFCRAARALRPGIREYEVEAEITAEFIRQGSSGHAFEPIVACGKNALILHYVRNSDICREGELLLLDFGAEVNCYASDCTRTLPVSGKFSPRQREVYEAVLRVFHQAREKMVPGTTLPDIHEQVGSLWEEEHIALGLYTRKEADERSPSDRLWRKYFMHGTSHSLGLDVHDPFDRSVPLEPGMVLTCEPAIYLPEEELGIRLENDILITGSGPVDLMEDIPIEPDDIEKLMQSNR